MKTIIEKERERALKLKNTLERGWHYGQNGEELKNQSQLIKFIENEILNIEKCLNKNEKNSNL
jgi:hypothetical protein